MAPAITKALKWLGLAAGSVITLLIALFLERKEGESEGKAEAETKAKIDRIEEAGKRNDFGPADDAWRGK